MFFIFQRQSVASSNRPSQSLASRMRDIRQDVQKRFSRLRSRSAERLSQRHATSERQQNAEGQQQQLESSLDDTYDEEATPTAGNFF